VSLSTSPSATVDTTTLTADFTGGTADGVGEHATQAGWPCALLGLTPPSVADRQSNPTADDLLPAVLALAPRGPAWGTDEAGDGQGASPVMRRVWRAIAAFFADVNARDFEVATQAFPSAATISLPDWETELGLPDLCTADGVTLASRLAAVRTRFGAEGGQSREYFVCVAAALGYDVSIEEPSQFMCDESECIEGGVVETYFTCDDTQCDEPLESFAVYAAPGSYGDEVAGGIIEDGFSCDDGECDDTPLETFRPDPDGDVWQFWVVRVKTLGETWFRADEGECDGDPIEGFLQATDLECILQRACPPHTRLVFSYDVPVI